MSKTSVQSLLTILTSIAISAAQFAGCSDDVHGTTAIPTTDAMPSTTADPTTGDAMTSCTTEDPTTGDIPTTSDTSDVTTGTGTTGAQVDGCLPDPAEYDCADAPVADNFCAYLTEACAAHEIEDIYCEIIMSKCRSGDECSTCFFLANTCAQVGIGCDDLMDECACVASGASLVLPPPAPEPMPEPYCYSDEDCGSGEWCDPASAMCASASPDDDYRCMLTGGLFGACDDGECDAGLECFTAKAGDVCLPISPGTVDAADPVVEKCGMTLGGLMHCDEGLGACAMKCGGACSYGVACDAETSVCVWPG